MAEAASKAAPFDTVAALLRAHEGDWQDAVKAARGGPKVFIPSTVTGFDHVTLMESLLGVALTLRGAEVHYLACDAALPACMRAEMDALPTADLFADYQLPNKICPGCVRRGDAAYQPLGLRVHRLTEWISPDEHDRARRLGHDTAADALSTVRLDGCALGEHALAGALRYYGRGDLTAIPDAEVVLRRYLEASALTMFGVRNLVAAERFDRAVFHHGIYVPQGVVGEVCRAAQLPLTNWNPSYRKNTFIFSHGDTYHHTLMDEPIDLWSAMTWGEEQERDILAYLKSRWTGTRDWIWFHEKPDEDFERFAAEMGVDRSRPIVGMLTNVMWDAQLHYPANAFPNMLDWAVRTVAYFRERPDLQLLIRVHPAEIRGTARSRQPIVAEIMRAFPDLPPNVFIIPPESPISTYAAMDACDSVIIYGTKTGVELTSRGIPVIVGGEAWIRNKGLTQDARSPDEYFSFLDALPARTRLSDAVTARARRYAYHFFFRRMIPLMFLEPRKGAIYSLAAQGLGDLKPGASPGLDVVCDGILTGTPFVYPAERLGLHEAAA